ncbi:hypothetical protein [Nostoc sp.]
MSIILTNQELQYPIPSKLHSQRAMSTMLTELAVRAASRREVRAIRRRLAENLKNKT